MADKKNTDDSTILGDINPVRHAVNQQGEAFRDSGRVPANDEEVDPLEGAGSRPEGRRRAGSRDVSDSSVGAPQVSGTRNMHSTGGATGSDLGNRPE